MPARKTTTGKGLGWRHQQQRQSLLRRLIDGALCWWCGLPMHKDAERNWDSQTLAADHSVPRAFANGLADRLLHGTCNSQRQDGRLDHVRPAVLGVHPRDWLKALAARGLNSAMTSANAPAAHPDTRLAMDW